MTDVQAATTDAEPQRLADLIDISVQVRHDGWNEDVAQLKDLCRRAALAVFRSVDSSTTPLEVSLVLADDDFVRALNRRFRDQDKPTNVLSFPDAFSGDAEFDGVPRNLPRNLGDVVIAHQIAAAEAARAKITLADHLSHLIVHGILHLLGYDHENDAEAGKMEGWEIEILGALDIADPYT